MNKIALVIMLALAVGCQKKETTIETPTVSNAPIQTSIDDAAKTKAIAAKDALFQRLSGRLMEVMQSEGPGAAIEVCSKEASEFAKTVSDEQGVRIGRTALKLRNAKNKPPTWASELISETATEPQFVSINPSTVGVLLPIKLKQNCLTCHGTEDSLAPQVKEQLTEHYPDDEATGFNEGDLRGWFWIEVPTGEQKSARAETPATTESSIIQHGRMHEVIGAKKHHGRIKLSEATIKPHLFAVGALEGLRGEFSVVDGEVVATEAISSTQMKRIDMDAELQAALLVGGRIAEWTEHTVEKEVPPEQYEAHLEQLAKDEAIDTSKPFVFSITGEFSDLRVHIIRGACPVHAKRNGIELPPNEQPFTKTFSTIRGTLVGLFAKDAVGDLTHPGTTTHTHVVFVDPESNQKVTGHVEQVGLQATSTVRLPAT